MNWNNIEIVTLIKLEFDMLYYNTVTPLLKSTLLVLMAEEIFAPFRLVGGTNLSLRLGHRMSDDIDLFTDALYGSLNFNIYETYLRTKFPYFEKVDKTSIVGFGRGYYIGNSKDDCIKLDLMYTDEFIRTEEVKDGVRMASVDDIVAMKINAILGGGRKKDFWDIHKLLESYSIKEIIALHKERHYWEYEEENVLNALINFDNANEMDDPICLEHKNWDDIKLDIINEVTSI